MKNTVTTELPWLLSLAMAVSAVASFITLPAGQGVAWPDEERNTSSRAATRMFDHYPRDAYLESISPATDPPTAGTAAQTAPVGEIWSRMRSGFSLPKSTPHAVQVYLESFSNHPRSTVRVLQRGKPYLFHILNRVEERGLPAELALLPFVESAFDPHAISPVGAAGIWQFMPGTATQLGLRQSWWYDGRKDIIDATEAALDYLTQLHRQFGDWLLALAAYNAGSGRVQRAIEQNRLEGKPVDFWHLPLPAETQGYVPRLIALRAVINNPADYNITLPPLPDTHYFTSIDTQGRIDLQVAARLAGVTEEEIKGLNPGINRLITPPDRPNVLLIPKASEQVFRERLARLPEDERIRSIRHWILQGDTLSTLAQKYRTTVDKLLHVNRLASTEIIAGEFLVIPGS